MRILSVATKSPWPTTDGGRLVLWWTLRGLVDAGHEVAVAAPAEPGSPADQIEGVAQYPAVIRPQSRLQTAFRAVSQGTALSIAKHHSDSLESTVATAISEFRPDVVHVEQLHALANCRCARAKGIPIVLRMQNVESSLWMQMSEQRAPRFAYAWEGRTMLACERRAMTVVSQTVTLTRQDAQALGAIAAGSERERISHTAPAFPSSLPAGEEPVAGEPAIVLVGSAGWWPNLQATQWFIGKAWNEIRKALPRARLHVFGNRLPDSPKDVVWHPAPSNSRVAFPRGAIVVVPLFVGSGIRMRILEAWARGLPVVATSVAARGLDAAHGRELLIADTPQEMAQSVLMVWRDSSVRMGLVCAGQDYLARVHDPIRTTRILTDIYAKAVNS